MKNTEEKAKNYFLKAIEDGKKRNYAAAIKKLRVVINSTDNIPEALLYLGRAYHETGRYNDAIIFFRLFITRMPEFSAGYFFLGRTHLVLNNYSRAVSCFSESLTLKPDFVPAIAYMGYALMRTGKIFRALEYLRNAVEKSPENTRIYGMYINCVLIFSMKEFKKERYDSALNGLLFLEQAGYSSVTTKLYIGIILKEQKKYQEAAGYISEASSYSPEDPLIKNILAELYVLYGDIEGASELLKTYKNNNEILEFFNSIKNMESILAEAFWEKQNYKVAFHYAIAALKKEKTVQMHLLAGECLQKRGKLDEAYNHYTRAMEIDSHSIEALYGRSVIKWLQQDYKGMLTELEKILSRDGDDDFAQYYLILCSWKTGEDFKLWRKKIEQRPKTEKDVWILTAKGWGHLSKSEKAEAENAFKNALKIDNGLSDTWEGLFESINDNTKKLIAAFKKYLSVFNNDIKKRLLYAELLLENENFSDAANEFKFIVSESTSDMNMLKKYAYCCRKSERYNEASVIYRQILASDPFNEKYLKMLLYCMRMDGRDIETLSVIESAVAAFKSPSMDLLLVYGVNLYRNGRDEEALSIFQKCIYKGCKDWRIYKNIAIIYKKKGLNDWSQMYMKKSEEAFKKFKKNNPYCDLNYDDL